VKQLRGLYPEPGERSIKKQLDALDDHCRRFLELSPLCVVATSDAEGRCDASPRGGTPGFVQWGDERTLWLPDSTGNHRLDSLTNIIATGGIGLLFLIPGVDETLRVNGRASLHDDAEIIGRFTTGPRPPRLVVQVAVREVFLHCAKALMRSRLWDVETQVDRRVLPTMGQMLKDQTGSDGPAESQEAMLARYAKVL
jgi:PPOX class probable FMN-dependent enzyme